MARRNTRKKKKRGSKTLAQRVTALEKAIKPKRERAKVARGPWRVGVGTIERLGPPSHSRDMTPPHIRRQLGL